MALEVAPASQASTGNWLVTYVPSASNALSVAVLIGASAKALTYSFTPDGFNYNITEASVADPRLTMAVTFSQPGTSTEVLEVKYVASSDVASANAILVAGLTGKLNIRRAVSNATAPTVGQKADVVTFTAGRQRPDAPVLNGLDTISQTLYITGATVSGGTLVA
jgi:hypothetical protein